MEPLRNELVSLEVEANGNKMKQEEVNKLIAHLERSIAFYKEEYAQLISQAQAIKTDLENVQIKVIIKSICSFSKAPTICKREVSINILKLI